MSEQSYSPERWVIGDTTLTSIVEAETAGIPVEFFFPEMTASHVQAIDWLPEGSTATDGTIAFRVQSFVIEHEGRLIVVDPCVGNHKKRALPFWNDLRDPWMDRFLAAGFSPLAVDIVVHTHLHSDHIGWDTRLIDGVWIPTFPNARHVYVGDELDWAREETDRAHQDPYADSIAPVLNARLGWEVEANTDLGHGLTLIPTPGHTPGHVSLRVATSAEPLVVTGDLLHHPIQFTDPSFAETADEDVSRARETRGGFFAEHAAAGTLIAGTHFPVAPVGRIVADGSAWRFESEAP